MPRWARIGFPDHFPPEPTTARHRAFDGMATSHGAIAVVAGPPGLRSPAMTAFGDLVARVVEAIEPLEPLDALEARDRAACLAWIATGAPLCRTEKPATPPQHLVAYAVAVDPDRDEVLLVDHRQAELWLPTGGHVEPGELPAAAARRELREELAVDADPLAGADVPSWSP
jgi:hypothetical protein